MKDPLANLDDLDEEFEVRRIVAPSFPGSALSIIETRMTGHELILEKFDQEMVTTLEQIADTGATIPEMAKELGVAYIDVIRARLMSEEFDHFCLVLETRAASIHIETARAGISDPKSFSAQAFDRVMALLNFTTHVENIHVHTTGAKADEAGAPVKANIGFNVEDFISKHGNEIIDAEVVEDKEETLEDIL